MRRRKVLGLVLVIGTFVYLMASILALYQNQRVKIEKGIEEALKAYSGKESLEMKELSKDFNLLLDEKLNISDMNQHIVTYEGSFARIEKNVNNVNNDIAAVEYNINSLYEKMYQIEKFYNELYEKADNMYSLVEKRFTDADNNMENLRKEIEDVENKISELEKKLAGNDTKQEENINVLQEQLSMYEERLREIESNVLYYQYDSGSGTLNIYGKAEEEAGNVS